MHAYKKPLLTLLLLVLSACASDPKKLPYALDPAGPDGLFVGSITYDGPVSGYRLFYRPVGQMAGGFVEAGAGSIFEPGFFAQSDIEGGDQRGNLFAVRLPPGDYEIYDWAVVGSAARLAPTRPFSLRYSVRPGRATYAGSFHFRQTNTLGLTVTGVRVDYGNAWQRDAALLPGKYPGLTAAMIDAEPQPPAEPALGGSSEIR